jgi:hypothetical protein
VGVGVKGIEGLGLKALGFGSQAKLGTRANPMIVQDVNAIPAGAARVGISSLGSVGSSASSSGVSGFIGGLLRFLPAFAGGGPVPTNTPVVVGERGPELFSTSTAGRIIPNSQMASSLGGDTHHHHYNIDARGSQSPAETVRSVTRALHAFSIKQTAGSLKALIDHNSRLPRMSPRRI